jgi:hypothetical protein
VTATGGQCCCGSLLRLLVQTQETHRSVQGLMPLVTAARQPGRTAYILAETPDHLSDEPACLTPGRPALHKVRRQQLPGIPPSCPQAYCTTTK